MRCQTECSLGMEQWHAGPRRSMRRDRHHKERTHVDEAVVSANQLNSFINGDEQKQCSQAGDEEFEQ